MILAHWDLSTPADLVNRVYGEALLPADMAALAPLVEAAGADGDEVAREILQEAGRELALGGAGSRARPGLTAACTLWVGG